MRAFQLTSYDGPSALRLVEVAEPKGQDGSAVVEVRAIGVNFPDRLITQGLYQMKPDIPFVPGCEIAGVIRSAPIGSGWSPGDRVAAFIWQGGYAELAEVPVKQLVAVPDDMSFDAAAGLLVNHHTVYFALARRGRLEPGEAVLVLGASGGIGSAAVQVAKGLGARVIAGVPDNERAAAVALEAGADELIVLQEDFAAGIRELTGGRGVDVVLDPLGDWIFQEAVRALAPEGRILVVGFAAGQVPELRVNRLLLRNVSAVGVAWGASLALDPAILAEGAQALHRMYVDGTVWPQIGRRFAFEELPEALEALGRGEIRGKGVAEIPAGTHAR